MVSSDVSRGTGSPGTGSQHTGDTDLPGRRRTSLTASSGLLGLSTVATRVTTLVVMALLARQAGIEAVGYYGLATLSASFTAAALSFGLPTYLTRDVSAGLVTPPEVTRIHCGRFAVLLLAAAGVAYPVAVSTLDSGVRVGFFLFFVASLLEQGNETAWVLVRGARRAWVEPLTNTSTGLLLLAACSVDAWLSGGLALGDAAGYVLVAAVVRSTAAFIVVGTPRHIRAPGRSDVVAHLRRALPYFASDLLGLFYFRGDVFVLAVFVSASEVGEYVSAAAVIGPVVQVAASMGIGALAYAARLPAGGRPAGGGGHRVDTGGPSGNAGGPSADEPGSVFQFFRTSGQAAAGLVFVGLPAVVAVLFGRAGHDILVLSMVLTLFLALRFANFGLSAVLLAHGRPTGRLLVLVLSICGNVGLNIALDGRFGASGAAWATVLTELIVAGSLLWFLRLPALVRPVAMSVVWVAAAAAALAGLLTVLAPAQVAFVTGGFLLAVAVSSLRLRKRGGPRTWTGMRMGIRKAEGA